MKFLPIIARVLLMFALMIQAGMGESIKLGNGASFEAGVHSIENGSHIFKIHKSQILQVKYGTPDYVRFANNTDVSTQIVKFVDNNYYLKIRNSDIKSIDSSAPSESQPGTTDAKDTAAAPAASGDYLFRIHGSNTIGAELAPALIKGYLASIGATNITQSEKAKEEQEIYAILDGKEIKIEVHAHGSSTGFKDIAKDSCDIAMASRRIKSEEAQKLSAHGDMRSPQNEHIIAIDGVAVFVNKKNPIFRLTTNQIKDIYTGTVTDWSQVGGEKGAIKVLARDENSGTWDTFNTLIMNELPLAQSATRYEDNKKLSDDVSGDINAIGFGGLPYILDTKELAISDGEMTIKPDKFTVATEDYPLARRLYLYTTDASSKVVKDFVEFVLSSKGQEIVDATNFIDLNIKEFHPIITDEMPTDYKNLAKELTRLSTNFRFEPNSRNLDNKALRDLERVVKYLKEGSFPAQNIYLIGFADNLGSAEKNLILSKERAKSVLYYFKSKGILITPDNIIGIGEDYPVANNADANGRDKNRRVEIWVRK